MDSTTAYTEKKFVWEANPSPTTSSFPLPKFLSTPSDAKIDIEFTVTSTLPDFIAVANGSVELDLTKAVVSSTEV